MAGPTIRRVQLGTELRRLREAAGMTRPEAAAAIKTSKSRLAAIELGRNVVSFSELVVLLRDHYHGTDEQLATLEEIREEASQRGWWSTYGLPEWLAGYVGLEHDASAVRIIELELIPGLLQTEEYARAVYVLGERLSPKEIERRTAVRIQRQARLLGPDRMQLTAVVSEGALLRCARQTAVAAEQLTKLLDRAQWPNVELRVLPFDAGLHVGMAGAFSLLSFPDQLLPDAAHQEYAVGGHIVDDQSVVSQLDTLFGKLRSQALGTDESLAMIRGACRPTLLETKRGISMDDRAPAVWRKSSRSSDQGVCVEVADLDGHRAVRDSKNPGGAMLEFTTAQWSAFTAGVRFGEFD